MDQILWLDQFYDLPCSLCPERLMLIGPGNIIKSFLPGQRHPAPSGTLLLHLPDKGSG